MTEGEVDPDKFRNELLQTLDVPSLVPNGVTSDSDATKKSEERGSNGNVPSIHVTQVTSFDT